MFNYISSFFKKHYLMIIVVIFAVFGFIASFILSVEKLDQLKNPNVILPCDINPFLSCGAVMKSPYASVFGIPWSYLGIAGYPAAILTGLIFIEKPKTSKWLAFLITVPPIFAFILSSWFMYISAYVIAVFCPWCMISAISSTNILFALITHHIKNDTFDFNNKFITNLQALISKKYNILFVIVWFILLFIFEIYPVWKYIF